MGRAGLKTHKTRAWQEPSPIKTVRHSRQGTYSRRTGAVEEWRQLVSAAGGFMTL